MMGRPELGTKSTCAGCHERFYDLNRSPAICPKCGARQPQEKLRALRPPRSTFGTRLHPRQPTTPVTIDDDVESVDTSEVEHDATVSEAEDEADDDVEFDPDLVKPGS